MTKEQERKLVKDALLTVFGRLQADDVQAIVYFTDGWGEVSPEVEPDVPVFWAVTEKSSYSENLAFGEVVYVDTADFYH